MSVSSVLLLGLSPTSSSLEVSTVFIVSSEEAGTTRNELLFGPRAEDACVENPIKDNKDNGNEDGSSSIGRTEEGPNSSVKKEDEDEAILGVVSLFSSAADFTLVGLTTLLFLVTFAPPSGSVPSVE